MQPTANASSQPRAPMLVTDDLWHATDPWISYSKTVMWASLAAMLAMSLVSISSAVVASGTVSVEDNYKTIQHLDGGIVAKILVKNGDRVKEGDILVRLDDTQVRATLGATRGRLHDALIQRARLEAERDSKPGFDIPADVAPEQIDGQVLRMMDAQRALFAARRTSRQGERGVLAEKRDQLKSELGSLEYQLTARRREADLNDRELKNVLPLFERGFVNQQRLGPLQKDQARLEGELGKLTGDLARSRSAIAEAELKLAQSDKEFLSQVVDELRKVEAQITEFGENTSGLADKLARTEVRAPRSGRVHALAPTTEGGVITPASAIAQVIPDGEKLIVEVRLQPNDIDKVRGGLPASVRFPAFNAKTTPKLEGIVTTVSPAQINDPQQQGKPYFTAQIEMSPAEIARLPKDHALVPGMPAEVFIETTSRSVLSYIVKPLIDAVSHVVKE